MVSRLSCNGNTGVTHLVSQMNYAIAAIVHNVSFYFILNISIWELMWNKNDDVEITVMIQKH